MVKGNDGQTCWEALDASIGPDEVLPYRELFGRVRAKGQWTDATIRRHVMMEIVNLLPAREEWEDASPFLFLRPDGRYERYSGAKHPPIVE